MTHTLSHTEVLKCPVTEIWEAYKHADTILPDIVPECFPIVEFIGGNGEIGTLRVVHLGPALPEAGYIVKERLDKIEEVDKAVSYTVLEGFPGYSSFTVEVRFDATPDNKTAATWTANYVPIGNAGPPENFKEITILMFKTFEEVILLKRTVSHSENLNASPDAIWEAFMQEKILLAEDLPEIFESITYVQGNGEPGSIRIVKFGPDIPFGEVVEVVDIVDDATKTVGFTVINGVPQYKYLYETLQFAPGPIGGTTTATWTATYVPVGATGPPVNTIAMRVFKALETAANANSSGVYTYGP